MKIHTLNIDTARIVSSSKSPADFNRVNGTAGVIYETALYMWLHFALYTNSLVDTFSHLKNFKKTRAA